jgi:protease PrsW
MHGAQEFLAMAVAVVSAAAWLFYFRWKDRARPEPPWVMLTAVAGGAVGIVLSLLGYAFATNAGADANWEELQANLGPAIQGALQVGAVEETSKLLVVLPIAIWSSHFDEVLDGIVYAGCSALGFATAEMWWLLAHGDWELLPALGKAVTSPISHALLSAPWGLGLSLAILKKQRLALPIGLLISIVAHGSYDLLLARPNLPPAVSAGVVLVIWVWFLWYSPRLARMAPVERSGTG